MLVHTLGPLVDYEGEVQKYAVDLIGDGKAVEVKTMTMRRCIINALNTDLPNEQWDAENKANCFALSMKIASQEPVDLTDEERVLIRSRAGKVMYPLALGRITELLAEPATNPLEAAVSAEAAPG